MQYIIIAAIIVIVIWAIKKGVEKPSSSGGAVQGQSAARVDRPRNGDSWGADMPAEPNQYNYPGTWQNYFSEVLRQEYPYNHINSRYISDSDCMVFMIGSEYSDEPQLMILVVSERVSDSRVLRSLENAGMQCDAYARRGVPYIRFYHDHQGWWNTRSYVVRRANEALNGKR